MTQILRRRIKKEGVHIKYSATAKVSPAVTTDWGANFVRSTWNKDTGIGRMYFDGDITVVPNSAFRQNDKLLGIISFPTTITSLRAGSFRFDEADTSARSALTSVKLHEGVTHVNERSFLACRKLTQFEFPNSVTTLGHRVFKDCTGLTKVTFGKNLIKFRDDDSTDANDGSGFFLNCTALKTILWNAVNCPDFLNSSYTPFTPDLPITTVKFGSSVKYIPSYIFFKCEGIKSITIPASCTSIGDRAFQGCSGLTKVTVNATTPPKIVPGAAAYGGGFTAGDGKNCVFRYNDGSWKILPKLTAIYVPADSVSKYKNDANWSVYSSIIKAIS